MNLHEHMSQDPDATAPANVKVGWLLSLPPTPHFQATSAENAMKEVFLEPHVA
jgi:hypothetical protein